MTNYESQLTIFSDAITDSVSKKILPLIKSSRSEIFPEEERLKVYTEGYIERLCKATKSDYPTLEHYLGPNQFDYLVNQYVKHTKSIIWDLNLYPYQFCEFLKNHIDNQSGIDLAILESAIAEVFWLEDSIELDAASLSALSMEQLSNKIFKPRSALRLLRLEYNANDYIIAFRQQQLDTDLIKQEQLLCIVRHNNEVQRLVLDKEEYFIINNLFQGKSFGEALDSATERAECDISALTHNLSIYITRWISTGIFQCI